MSTTTNTLELGHAATQNIDRTMSGLKDSVSQATASIEQAQSAMRQNMEKAMRSAQEMFAFAQGNFEAMTHCSQTLAAGFQEMAQAFAASSKASMDESLQTFKAIGSAKSIKEAMDLQTALVRASLEKAVSQTSHLTDSSMKLSEKAFAPLTARIKLATETFGRTA